MCCCGWSITHLVSVCCWKANTGFQGHINAIDCIKRNNAINSGIWTLSNYLFSQNLDLLLKTTLTPDAMRNTSHRIELIYYNLMERTVGSLNFGPLIFWARKDACLCAVLTPAHAYPCFSGVSWVAGSIATRLSHHFGYFPPVFCFGNFDFASTVPWIMCKPVFHV